MKQPTDDYCVVTSLPSTNTQAFQASGVWGEAGRFFYMASLHLFHRELFFLFLKKTEEKNKRILLCNTKIHPKAHFPQLQCTFVPSRETTEPDTACHWQVDWLGTDAKCNISDREL